MGTLTGLTENVRALAVLRDGCLPIDGSADGSIKLWDVTNDACATTLVGHTRDVAALVMMREGRLASGAGKSSQDVECGDGQVRCNADWTRRARCGLWQYCSTDTLQAAIARSGTRS